MSIALETAGFTTRTFRTLSSLGLLTLEDVVRHGPDTLPRRTETWQDIVRVLARWKGRRPELIEPIDGYLREGGRVPRAQAVTAPRLEGLEGRVQHELEQLRRPAPLRLLKERLQGEPTVDLGERLLAHPDFVVYPYGRSRLVGLSGWGTRGFREAAQLTYNLLALQLEQWESEGHQPGPEALEAVREVAEEHRDQHLLRLCRRHQKAPPDEAPVPPEVPAEPQAQRPEPATQELAPDPETNLFQNLPATFDSTREAAERILQAAPQGRPWSLCETRPSEGDWLWLQEWARSIQPNNLGWLRSTARDLTVLGQKRSRRETLGLLFWMLASEEARRHAREGHVWFVVPPLFRPATREELFSDGYPRPDLRDSLEAAALRTEMRNAFGVEGSQAWYLTIFLQFGFTRRGVESLPYWLSSDQTCTQAVAMLRQQSPDYAELWRTLLHYRREPQRVADTRRHLERSCFILPDAVEAILHSALQATDSHGPEVELLEPPLFAPARLLWPEAEEPRFLLVPHRNPPTLADSGYEILKGEEFLGRLLRLPNGTYEMEPPEIVLEPHDAETTVTLVGDSLEDRHDFVVSLVDPEADVLLFDAESGEPKAQVSNQRAVLVLTGEHAELRPPAAISTAIPALQGRLHLLPAGWSEETELWSEGANLGPLLSRQVPDWVANLRLGGTSRGLRLGEVVELDVLGLPPGAQLRSARYRSHSLRVARDRVWLPLGPDLAGSRPGLNLVVEVEGRRHRCYCSCLDPLKITGATRQTGDTWDIVDGVPRLASQEVAASRFRFFLGGEPTSHWAVLEGDVFLGRPKPQAARLNRPSGYGASLSYGRGPYNALQAPATLVKEVTDSGCLQGHTVTESALELRLQRPLEGDSQHLILAWLQDGWVYTARASDMATATGVAWEGEVLPPDAAEQPQILALAYQGRRLGTSAPDRFTPTLGEPYQTACLLRWLHLPLAAQRWRDSLEELVANSPVDCLRAWVLERSFEVDGCRLVFSDESVAWLSIVRGLFQNWKPTPDQARSLGPMDEVFLALVRVDPLLAARLGGVACSSAGERGLLTRLACQDQSLDDLLLLTRQLSGADDAFIRTLTDRVLDGRPRALDGQNYRLLCQLECFTRYVAARSLERMAPGGARTASDSR